MSLTKDLKIISSMAGIVNCLSALRTVLTVGIIVFTVLETITTLLRIKSDNLLEN